MSASTQQSTAALPLPTPRALLTQLLATLPTLSNPATSSAYSTTAGPPPTSAHAIPPPAGQPPPLSPDPASNSAPAHLLRATRTTTRTTTTPSSTTTTTIGRGNQTSSALSHPPARSLFLTLHALFPHVLLPALDTLDRGLVLRLVPLPITAGQASPPPPPAPPATRQEAPVRPASHATGLGSGDGSAAKRGWTPVYYVRSSRSRPSYPKGGAKRGGETRREQQWQQRETQLYEVRLGAWNCSCAAFAFSEFGRVRGGGGDRDGDGEGGEVPRVDVVGREDAMLGVEFGGLAAERRGRGDGVGVVREDERLPNGFGGSRLERNGVSMPVCKHLLACLLVERCPPLAGCVEERMVGWEEMVGWAAGWA